VNVQTNIFIIAYQPNKNTELCILLIMKPEETTTAMQQQQKHHSAPGQCSKVHWKNYSGKNKYRSWVPTGVVNKNDFTGEGQQKFTGLDRSGWRLHLEVRETE
jgi:hypothetical protein